MSIDNKELYERVKNNISIVDAIKKYILLEQFVNKDKESSYWYGNCPNHTDEEAHELIVSTTNKEYYCFTCHTHGDVIDFVARIGGMNKLTAARFLAKTNKIDIETTSTPLNGENNVDTKDISE